MRMDWETGTWTHPPVRAWRDGPDLLVEAREGSDAWRQTSYGFVHASEHALVAPLPLGSAVEVTFTVAFDSQFDQAGVFLTADEEHWIKAGVEFADGVPHLGAVVTHCASDWSVSPVPQWSGRRATVRASRSGDAVTIRAGLENEPLALVRVAPFAEDAALLAGPLCCAPTREALVVRFHRWEVCAADPSLHP